MSGIITSGINRSSGLLKAAASGGNTPMFMAIRGLDSATGDDVRQLLDDAAYFASQTHEKKYFLYTINFQINFLKPIFQGKIISRGKLLKKDSNKFISKAKLFDNEGNEVANGEGIFVKSNIFLKNLNSIDI